MQSYKFIVNPVPLNKKRRKFLKRVFNRLAQHNVEFSVEYTSKEKNAESIARKSARENFDVVVACGGDGTIREVVNGIYKSKSALGVLPLGTSNDFALHLGINKLNKAFRRLMHGSKRKMDLGYAEFVSGGNKQKQKSLFCSTSGIGFDAKMLKANKSKAFLAVKKILKKFSYSALGFLIMFNFSPTNAEITLNKKRFRISLFMLNANFIKSMSGLKVSPYANINNGRFDIFLAEDASILKKILSMKWYFFMSRKIPFREVSYITGKGSIKNKFGVYDVKNFAISTEKPIEVQLNGDFVGYTPAKFKVLPRAIDIII